MRAPRVREAVELVEGAAVTLDTELADAEGLQYAFLADTLHRLREARASLQRSEAAIEAEIVALSRSFRLPHDTTEVVGVGVVEVLYGKERKAWDHPGLAKVVVEQLIEGRGGEIPSPWDVRDALLEAGHVDYWRVKVLRSHGIDPDEYCEAVPGLPRVVITGSTP